jgi:hypothetical protein
MQYDESKKKKKSNLSVYLNDVWIFISYVTADTLHLN